MNNVNKENIKDQRHNRIIDVQQMSRQDLEKAFLATSSELEEFTAQLTWY